MAKKKQKASLKDKLKLWLGKAKDLAGKAIASAKANKLGLLNMALSVVILVKLCQLEDKLLWVYIGLAEGLGLNVMLIIQLAAKLLGGEPA